MPVTLVDRAAERPTAALPPRGDRAVAMAPQLAPIGPDDLAEVGVFLNEHLNGRLSPTDWVAAVAPPWPAGRCRHEHGYLLRDSGGAVVGVQIAFYSERDRDGQIERFCNLGALCVREDHRAHGLRLVRAVLAQKGYTFTDLSPSGNVVELNRRLRFTELDTTSVFAPTVPGRSHGIRLVAGVDAIEPLLAGSPDQLRLLRDHRHAGAARHVLLVRGDRRCYVVLRRDRFKRLPVFASVLHASDPALLAEGWGVLTRHLLAHGLLAVIVPDRLAARPPRIATRRPAPRRVMVRTAGPLPAAVDGLYSELVCVPW